MSLVEKSNLFPAERENGLENLKFKWPASDKTGAAGILSHARKHFPAVMEFIKRRGTAIQAGGNVGVYPANLARFFSRVHTFEPDQDNFDCLRANLASSANIQAYNFALGSKDGTIDLERTIPGNCGAYKPRAGSQYRTSTVDSLGLKYVDLIWLDVEGYETEALDGAIETVREFRPVLIFENIGMGNSPRVWAERRGYKFARRIANDDIMLPC